MAICHLLMTILLHLTLHQDAYNLFKNGTPEAPKRARFAQIAPFGGPGGLRAAPGGLIWSLLPPVGPAIRPQFLQFCGPIVCRI